MSTGTTWDLGSVIESNLVMDPSASEVAPIVGMGIAGNDHTYVWYADGMVSSGTSRYHEHHQNKTEFTLPSGKNPWDIISMAVRGTDNHIFTFYRDGKFSEGWSQDLGSYNAPQDFELPEGKVPSDIVGIASTGSNGRFYAWYSDGTVSSGTASNLGAYQNPYAYDLPPGKKIGHIIDIAIAGSTNNVYTWYHDVEAGDGHVNITDHVDARAMDVLRRYQLPGLSVAVSKNGRMVLEKGYGYRKRSAGHRMTKTARGLIGSVSKIITTMSAMRLAETTGFSIDDDVYGPGGGLPEPHYEAAQDMGRLRHNPIVAKAIASNDRVYTWDQNGYVSSGTSADPDLYSGPLTYTLAPNMDPEDVRAIAITPSNQTTVWYDDGTFSVGTSRNLDSIVPRDSDVKVSMPSGYIMDYITGMAIASTGVVYTWYEDGTMSAGTRTDLDANIPVRGFSIAGTTSYKIRAMAIAKSNDRVYTWTTGNKVLRGTSTALGSIGTTYYYQVPNSSWNQDRDWFHWYRDMKIDQLMSHTAGFKGGGDVAASVKMHNKHEDLLTYTDAHKYTLRTRKLLFEPGTSASYSNHGMGLLGHIIAERSGMSYREYARGHIIDPLNLQIRAASSGQWTSDMWRHEYVDGIPESYLDVPTNDLGLAAGAWKSSAGDMVRLMLATDGDSNHPDILFPGTLSLMETQPYPGISNYAHGWKKFDSGMLGHGGRLGGGTSYIAKFPAGALGEGSDPVSVAVIANIWIDDAHGGSNGLNALVREIAKAVERENTGTWYDLH